MSSVFQIGKCAVFGIEWAVWSVSVLQQRVAAFPSSPRVTGGELTGAGLNTPPTPYTLLLHLAQALFNPPSHIQLFSSHESLVEKVSAMLG